MNGGAIMEAKVLLVYPPSQLMPTEMPRPDGSLGLLYLASALETAGVKVDVLDASVGMENENLENTFNNRTLQPNGLIRVGMTQNHISEIIALGGYSIVGINSNFTPQTKMAFEVADAAKNVSEDILVIAGGVNARALPERFLAKNVDIVCATEGERVIVRVVQSWEQNKILEIPGTMIKKEGKIIKYPVKADDVLTNLDDLPMPAWHKLPFRHYDGIVSAGRGFLKSKERSASLMTSRGCTFACSYCHISTEKKRKSSDGSIGTLRIKSIDRVIEEVEQLNKLGVSKIFLEDDSLLAHKFRVKEIFTRVASKGIKIADVNGVNLVHFLKGGMKGKPVIDVEYLEFLASTGFDQIVFPVESASQRIINKYATGKLNHSVLDVVELVKAAVKAGITCPINMMIGFPDETEEEIKSSIELGRRLVEAGADYCSLYIPIPFPGSRLHKIALHGGYLDSNFDTDVFNWRKPVMKNTTVPLERIEELQQWGWRDINTSEYLRKRLEMDIGSRWKSNNV